jgi:hypothetical protein
MFGIAFDSMDAAMNHLLARGVITEEQAADFVDDGEIWGLYVEWQLESCYSGSNGVLGCHIKNVDLVKLEQIIANVQAELGNDNLKLHNFVYWY